MVWLVTRWEGDYDIMIGIYSSREKAISAAQLHVDSGKAGREEYNLFDIALDTDPPLGRWACISEKERITLQGE